MIRKGLFVKRLFGVDKHGSRLLKGGPFQLSHIVGSCRVVY